MELLKTKESPIAEFYAGKSVFVTGGTGFIGKVLLEKLLYTCLDIDKIYILVRGTEKATSLQRVEELLKKPVFDRVRKENPQSLDKIIAVAGNLEENNLGIDSVDELSFIDKISVVFHSAATVRFNERLDVAVNLNYEATKKVLNLCHRMKYLKSFVYMSTAFINPQNKYLDEVIYPAPVKQTELQVFIDQNGMDDQEKLTKFLCGRPNTYTFTKALSENYVAENHGRIPTSIIRPSIVTSSVNEPLPGWIDTWSAAAAIVASTSLGYSRVIVGSNTNVIDLVPVDYVTNLAIVAAANNRENNLEIFNCCTSACNPVFLFDLYKISKDTAVKNCYNDFKPLALFTKDGIFKEAASFILEKLPAMFADVIMRMKGENPRYVKLLSKMAANRERIKYFSSRTYSMCADRTIALSHSLSERDAKLFPFNPQAINWKQYLPGYLQGIRKFLLRK